MSSRQDVSWPRLFRAKHAAHVSGSSSRPAQDKTHPPIVDDDRLPRPKPRWNPTPEQVSILENYFNSGTMNPSREEIQRIKNLLLQFGNVEDANVFYWFQNKKSRTRQKVSRDSNGTSSNSHVANTAEKSANSFPYKASEAIAPPPHTTGATAYMQQQHNFVVGDSSSVGPSASAAAAYELGNAPPVNRMPNQDQTNQQQTLYACGNINPNLPYTNMVSSNLQSSVTVSINGHPVHMPPALLDIRSLFGVRAVIYDVSINQFLPMNDAGVTMWPLMNGHSYLVIDTGGFPGI